MTDITENGLNDIQRILDTASKQFETNREQKIANLMGLSEASEVVNHARKHLFQGHDLDLEYIAKELGDTLFYLIEVASSYGLEFEFIASMMLCKVKERFPSGKFSEKESIQRIDTNLEHGILWTKALQFQKEFFTGTAERITKDDIQTISDIHDMSDEKVASILVESRRILRNRHQQEKERKAIPSEPQKEVKRMSTATQNSQKNDRQKRVLKNVYSRVGRYPTKPSPLRSFRPESVHPKNREAFVKLQPLNTPLNNLYDLITLPMEDLANYFERLCQSGHTNEENAVFFMENVYDITWYRWGEMMILNTKQAMLERARANEHAAKQLSFDYVDEAE